MSTQPPCATIAFGDGARVTAARGHLLRWNPSPMLRHRFRCPATREAGAPLTPRRRNEAHCTSSAAFE